MMYVGYARVSTIDQNPQMQIDALEIAGCTKIFIEKKSGAKVDRPQFREALNYLREGDTLVVWKQSRLARSLKQLIETAQELKERNINLKILTEHMDTSTSGGRLYFNLMGSIAEFQRENIVENTLEGLASAKKRGRIGGRPKKVTEDKLRQAQAMLRDQESYPFISDIIKTLGIGRTSFYYYFSPEKIQDIRNN